MDTALKYKNIALFEPNEIDLIKVMRSLWQGKWLILTAIVFSFIIGAVIVFLQKPQYKTSVLLQLDSSKSTQANFVSDFTRSINGNDVSVATTQIALIQSRFILEPVIKMLGLDISVSIQKKSILDKLNPFFNNRNFVKISFFKIPSKYINHRFQLRIESINKFLLFNAKGEKVLDGNLGVTTKNKDGSIAIKITKIKAPVGTYFNLIKKDMASVGQAVISNLEIKELGGKKNQSTGVFNLFFQGDNPKQIVKILNAVAQVSKEKDAIKKSQEASQTLSFLYKQLPEIKKQLEQSEFKLNGYRAKSGKINIKLQAQTLLNKLSTIETKLNELHIRKLEILPRYTKNHPAYIDLDTQMQALSEQQHNLEVYLKTLPASDQITVNLQRDVKVKNALYLILLNKIQELQVVQAGTISGIHILGKAKIPNAPIPSHKSIIYISSILIGFFIGSLVIMIRRMLSPIVEDPHWCEQVFDLPNLAIIPYSKEQHLHLHQSVYKEDVIPLLAFTSPRSFAMEALRSLRTNLQIALVNANNNVVSIMGLSPSVGKSFVTANLAYLMASTGKRILIIDADLRKGVLHKYFNISFSPGLSDILIDDTSIEKALINVEQNKNLFCIPRGTYPVNPSELLMNVKFKQLLNNLSTQFDVVFIDTAPILLVTDAVIVAGYSGINYIVLGAGKHQPKEIELSLKKLYGSDIRINGTIFNFSQRQTERYPYGAYDNYSYYYEDNVQPNC